jgi:hypothetical protein
METGDEYHGLKQSQVNPKFYFAVSKCNVWNKYAAYDLPLGFRWATTDDDRQLVKPQLAALLV